nr:MAG TPA: hypothetical protein [Caudoviricetes sp.]
MTEGGKTPWQFWTEKTCFITARHSRTGTSIPMF